MLENWYTEYRPTHLKLTLQGLVALNIQIMAVRDVMPYNLVGRDQCSGGICCLSLGYKMFYPEYRCSRFLICLPIFLTMYTYLLYKFLYALYNMLVEFNSFNCASCDRCHLCFGNWRFDLIQGGKLQNKFNHLKHNSSNITSLNITHCHR